LCFVPEVCRVTGSSIEDARASTAFAVILLRLVWTASELAAVALLYWLPACAPAGWGFASVPATELNLATAAIADPESRK
jgi:hypothetical protein